MRNKAADYCRSASRQGTLAETVAGQQKANDNQRQADSCDAVAEALWQLPADSRELLTLRYGEDLNILELAVVLGIPAGTVKSRLYHAREQLRQILKGDDP